MQVVNLTKSTLFFLSMKRSLVTLSPTLCLIFLLMMATNVSAQLVQITQSSAGSENHYSLTEPNTWEGDFFVGGTVNSSFYGSNARLKRVKPDGNVMWDFNLTADDMENRAMHVISSDWGGADATVFGFMDEGQPEALIYGVKDDGTISLPSKLANVNAANIEGTTFLHGIACSDGGWIAVGEWKAGFVRSGLVVKFSSSGSISWSLHLDSQTSNGMIDFDALNHVLEIDDLGYFVGGSGNFVDPNNITRQGAFAAMIDADGGLSWGSTYVHSEPSYETVAASAVLTATGKLYQIVNGRGDVSFLKNGFSIHQIDVLSGNLGGVWARNIHIQEHPLKAMSARQHPLYPDRILVAGFLEVDANDIGYEPNDPPAYGIVADDRPPFLMEVEPAIASPGVSCISWHQVYDVPSTLFGLTMPIDRYDVFSTFGDQPQIFHPEMLWTNALGENHLIGYRDVNGVPNQFDMEFIGTNSTGATECPTYQANIVELERLTESNTEVTASVKAYELFSFQPDIYDYSQEIIPCDACFPEVSMTTDAVSCESYSVTITPVDDDPTTVCYSIDWGDGTVTSESGAATYSHDWVSGFANVTVQVTPYCCDLPSLTGSSHSIEIDLPDGCDCEDCTPWMRACQVDFDNPIVSYPSSSSSFGPEISVLSLLECPSGCDESPYTISASLGSFLVFPIGANCLDDVSGVWLLNGVVVETFACGDYTPMSATVSAAGTYDIDVILTDCADESCTNTMSRSIDVGECVPPVSPRFDLLDGGVIPCPLFKCAKAMTPLQSTCSSMNSEWIVDGDFLMSGSVSASYCFDWGWHDVELRYTCLESGVTSSSTQNFYCGPSLSEVPALLDMASEWVPFYFSIEAEVDSDCGLTIDGPKPVAPLSSFNPFERLGLLDLNLEGTSDAGDSFAWNLTAKTDGGIAIQSHQFDTDGASYSWDGDSRTGETFEAISEVCFELTGPDWLIQNSSVAIGYCVDVLDCIDPVVECTADLNDDGIVSVSDLLIVLGDFGSYCDE